MEYFVYHEGKQIGPLSLSELAARLANGDFAQSDHVWHEGLNYSRALSEVFRSQAQADSPVQVQSPQDQKGQALFGLSAKQPRSQPGMPPDVAKMIRAFAEREYPDDYSMQKHTIEEQRESFCAVQDIRASDIPAGVLAKIRERAATEYPDDYSMQK